MVNHLRTREELVQALIENREQTGSLLRELRVYGWDSETELVTLRPEHLIAVLQSFRAGNMNSAQVREWANAIERREDIAMLSSHARVLDEMVFWLANPEINYPINPELAALVIVSLELNRVEPPFNKA